MFETIYWSVFHILFYPWLFLVIAIPIAEIINKSYEFVNDGDGMTGTATYKILHRLEQSYKIDLRSDEFDDYTVTFELLWIFMVVIVGFTCLVAWPLVLPTVILFLVLIYARRLVRRKKESNREKQIGDQDV